MVGLDRSTANWTALIAAVIMGFALILWQQYTAEQRRLQEGLAAIAERQARQAEPVEKWFEVRNISIPDFVEGEDPMITYDREVKSPTKIGIRRNVDVQPADNLKADPVCAGRSVRSYDMSTELNTSVELSAFIAAPCALLPGAYQAKVSWIVLPDGYPPKYDRYTTNIFRVLPRGSQLSVTPEQSKILEQIEPSEQISPQ